MSPRRRCAAATCAIAAWLALAAASAPAQTPAEPAAPAPDVATAVAPPASPPAPAGPAAVAVSEIAAAVEGAYKRLAEIQQAAQPGAAVLEIEKQALGKQRLFRERVLEDARMLEGELSLDELDEIAARATAAEKQLADWQKTLSGRSQQLEALRDETKQLRETWKLTYDAARAESAPAELVQSVTDLRSEIRAVEKQIGERFGSILKMQGRIAEESLAVSVVTQDVRRARFAARGRIFARDRKPLHEAILAVEAVDSVLDRVRDGLERDIASLRTFASLEGGQRMVAHALLFLLLLLLAVRTKIWSRARRRVGKSLGPTEAVLDHPVSTALLFALLLTPWVYPFLPRSYQTVLGLLGVVPILVLLPNVLAPSFRREWYALAALLLLDRLRGVFQPVELVERTLFALLTLGGVALAIRMLRQDRFAELTSDRHRGLVRLALRSSLAALVVSVIANLAGFVSLSRVLGQGVLRAAFSGVVLYAAVSVARPLVAGLLRTTPAKALHLLQGRRDAIERATGRVIGIAAALWWLVRVGDGFALGTPLREFATAVLTSPIPLGAVGFSLAEVGIFLLTAGAGVLLARFVTVLLDEDVFPRTSLARGVPHAISATVRYAVLVGSFLLAAAAAGFDWSKITLLAGAFGVGIGFGLQNVVNNFISGLILLYERPIQVGDTVEVGSLVGEVKRIGIRSSSVRTWQGAEVIVPNANLISEQVVNWTLSDRTRRIEIPVGVSYEADPEAVLALLEETATAHPDVMSEPPPMAVFLGFGDSALNFELRIWTANFDRAARVRSEVAIAVHRALRRAHIDIPFPQRDVRVTLTRPGADPSAR